MSVNAAQAYKLNDPTDVALTVHANDSVDLADLRIAPNTTAMPTR